MKTEKGVCGWCRREVPVFSGRFERHLGTEYVAQDGRPSADNCPGSGSRLEPEVPYEKQVEEAKRILDEFVSGTKGADLVTTCHIVAGDYRGACSGRDFWQRAAMETAAQSQEATAFAQWLAIHDCGFGDGKRSRLLQRAAHAAMQGDESWRKILQEK